MSGPSAKQQRRREERAAAEAEVARATASRSRLQLALGGLVGVAAIVVAVIVFSGPSDAGSTTKAPAGVSLPARKVTDLRAAAKLAGCSLATYPSEGREHTTRKVVYKTNPPTSGPHYPVWSQDGIYPAESTPPLGMLVHTLEHGRIDIQYRPGAPKATVDALEALGSERLRSGKQGYHTLVFQNPTGMKPEVAATAWTRALSCPKMTDGVYDAVRAFRVAYTDKGPELIP